MAAVLVTKMELQQMELLAVRVAVETPKYRVGQGEPLHLVVKVTRAGQETQLATEIQAAAAALARWVQVARRA